MCVVLQDTYVSIMSVSDLLMSRFVCSVCGQKLLNVKYSNSN